MRKFFLIVLALALLLPCLGAAAAEEKPMLRGKGISELYSFDYQNRTYHKITDDADVRETAGLLRGIGPSDGSSKAGARDGARGFLAFLSDGERIVWYVTADMLSDDVGVIPSSQSTRAGLLAVSGLMNGKYPGVMQGMAHMDISKIKWIEYRDSDNFGTPTVYFGGNDPAVIKALADCLRSLEVKPKPIVVKYPAGQDIFRPSIGYSQIITIHMESGYQYTLIPGGSQLEVWTPMREDVFYQLAKPAQFEALRQTMVEQGRTLVEVKPYEAGDYRHWSTADPGIAGRFKTLLGQRSGKVYSKEAFNNAMINSLHEKLLYWNLWLYGPVTPGVGIASKYMSLYLPEGDSGQGFYWDGDSDKGWYLTEQATKEIIALMQPMTELYR